MSNSAYTSGGAIRMDIEKLKVEQTITAPIALLCPPIPLVFPWFSSAQLAEKGIFFCIGMDTFTTKGDSSNYVATPARKVWIQAATKQEMELLKQDPSRTAVPNKTGTRLDLVIASSDFKMSSSSRTLTMSLEESNRETSLNTLKPMYLFDRDKRCHILKTTWTDWRKESDSFSMAVSLELHRTFVVGSNDQDRDAGCVRSAEGRCCSVLQQMLTRTLFPDVTLQVGEKTLSAHRAILAAHSKVLEACFTHDTKEKQTGVLEIPDVKADVMEVALQFMYGGDISRCSSPVFMDLLPLAEKYALLELKQFTEEALIEVCDVDVLEVLCLADSHNAARLRRASLRRVGNNPSRKRLLSDAVLMDIASKSPKLMADLVKVLL